MKLDLDIRNNADLVQYLYLCESFVAEEKKKEALSFLKGLAKDKSYSDEFLEFWEAYPERAGNTAKSVAYEAYKKLMNMGVISHEELMDNVRSYREYCNRNHLLNTNYVKMASTYLGRQRGYECDWSKQDLKW